MARKPAYPKGVRRHGAGLQTFCKVNGIQVPRKSWPIDTPLSVLTAWIETQQKIYGGDAVTGFAADIDVYMARKTGMGRWNQAQRRQQLDWFAGVFGKNISRHAVTSDMVADAFATLRKTLALSTVKNYRIALRAFFYAMNGADGANPVRLATLPTLPPAVAKGRSMDTIARVLAAFADKRSGAYHRARVMAYTGLPPALLMKIAPADLEPSPAAPEYIQVPERKKGAGVASRRLKLTTLGREAFAAFHRRNLYGAFHVQCVNYALKTAARKIGIATGDRRFTLYHLRHSFGTEIYRRTKDTATTGRLLMHAEGSKETLMYVKAAHADVDDAAIAAFDAAVATPVHVPETKLPAKVASVRKFRVIKRLQRTA